MAKLSDLTPVQHFNEQIKLVSEKAKAVGEHGQKILTKWVDYASTDWLEKVDALVLRVKKPLIALDEKIDEIDASIERSLKKRKQDRTRAKQQEADVGRFLNEGGAQTAILEGDGTAEYP